MCIIIIKDDNKMLDHNTLVASASINPHGLGVLWLDEWNVEYYKSEEYDVLQTTRPFIAHFRYATVGKVSPENCHPFAINDDEVLFQNGTIYNLGDNNMTDTEHMAMILSEIPRHLWAEVLEMNDCRFVTANLTEQTYELYNEHDWVERDGVMYSKKNVLDLVPVAVYGTLKKNYSNYYHYLKSSTHVGSGETKDKYPLVISGLPYVMNKKGVGHNVDVDVFLVSQSTLKQIDSLEGHPTWYERKKIQILMDNGGVMTAWLYFNDTIEDTGVYHKTYTQEFTPYQTSRYNTNFDDWHDCEWVDELDMEDTNEQCPQCRQEGLMKDPYYPDARWCMECEDYVYGNEIEYC